MVPINFSVRRFAVLDPTIKDLERKHMAEIVMGPVVFDDFVLEQEGIILLFGPPPPTHTHTNSKTERCWYDL